MTTVAQLIEYLNTFDPDGIIELRNEQGYDDLDLDSTEVIGMNGYPLIRLNTNISPKC